MQLQRSAIDAVQLCFKERAVFGERVRALSFGLRGFCFSHVLLCHSERVPLTLLARFAAVSVLRLPPCAAHPGVRSTLAVRVEWQVLAVVLQQLVDQTPVPRLFMRTVIQTIVVSARVCARLRRVVLLVIALVRLPSRWIFLL